MGSKGKLRSQSWPSSSQQSLDKFPGHGCPKLGAFVLVKGQCPGGSQHLVLGNPQATGKSFEHVVLGSFPQKKRGGIETFIMANFRGLRLYFTPHPRVIFGHQHLYLHPLPIKPVLWKGFQPDLLKIFHVNTHQRLGILDLEVIL